MLPDLQTLAALRSCVRQTLSGRGLTEVVTPVSLPSPGGEAHLEAPPVDLTPLGSPTRRAYLRTSPEVWHKKLLAAGSGPIFEIAPCFRDAENGPWHDLEFEMIEWYRPGGKLADLRADCLALLTACAAAAGNTTERPVRSLTVAQAFLGATGVALIADGKDEPLRRDLAAAGLRLPQLRMNWDDLFFLAWVDRVEPWLKGQGVVFIERFPASQATMAKLCSDDPNWCERLEVYVDGVELANGFFELTDGEEQRRRFRRWQNERIEAGRSVYPEDNAFFQAVDDLPESAGIALGFDRLAAISLAATDLSSVRPFRLTEIYGAPSCT
jgi:elongation factor P--(R)-beta-lysine ligase